MDQDKKFNSPEELEQDKNKWTLSSDLKLLGLLKTSSEEVFEKMKTSASNFDQFAFKTNTCANKIDNLITSLLILTNNRFIENRVYEEDIQDITNSNQNSLHKPLKYNKKSESDHNQEIVNQLKQAIDVGIDTFTDRFKINFEQTSHIEEFDKNEFLSRLYTSENDYVNRPLPYMIGSQEYNVNTFLGLKAEHDQGPVIVLSEKSTSSSLENDTVVQQTSSISHPNQNLFEEDESDQSDFDDQSSGDHVFEPPIFTKPKLNVEKSDFSSETSFEPPGNGKLNQRLKAEIESKLAKAVPTSPTSEPDENVQVSHKLPSLPESLHNKKPKKTLFDSSDEDSDNDQVGGVFSFPNYLRDNVGPSTSKSMLQSGNLDNQSLGEGSSDGDKSLVSDSFRNKTSVHSDQSSSSTSTSASSTLKPSALAAVNRTMKSIFGSDDSEDDDIDIFKNVSLPSKEKTIKPQAPVQNKSSNIKFTGSSLFDSDDENVNLLEPTSKQNDQFSKKDVDVVKPQSVVIKKDKTPLLEDSSDDDDLFSDNYKSKQSTARQFKQETSTSAVSIDSGSKQSANEEQVQPSENMPGSANDSRSKFAVGKKPPFGMPIGMNKGFLSELNAALKSKVSIPKDDQEEEKIEKDLSPQRSEQTLPKPIDPTLQQNISVISQANTEQAKIVDLDSPLSTISMDDPLSNILRHKASVNYGRKRKPPTRLSGRMSMNEADLTGQQTSEDTVTQDEHAQGGSNQSTPSSESESFSKPIDQQEVQQLVQNETSKSSTPPMVVEAPPLPTTSVRQQSLFASSDEDEFDSIVQSKSITANQLPLSKPVTNLEVESKLASDFDEKEGSGINKRLLEKRPEPVVLREPTKLAKQQKSLFDSDEEENVEVATKTKSFTSNLNATKSFIKSSFFESGDEDDEKDQVVPTKQAAIVANQDSEQTPSFKSVQSSVLLKKKSIFDDSDSDDDLFTRM